MKVQRVTYERTGGFAGMRLSADFEPEDLPEEQSCSLLELLDDMDFDELPEQLTGSSSMPDQFTYQITVRRESREHTVITGDESAPEKMQELIRLLDRIAKRKP